MKKNAKRLTVTYGAFSVTLEGFDDPVEMVAAIAGHLRDLARETPGFGAPQPAEAVAHAPSDPAQAGHAAAPAVRHDDAEDDADSGDPADFFALSTPRSTAKATWEDDLPPLAMPNGGSSNGFDRGERQEDGAVGELEAILRRLEARKAAIARAEAPRAEEQATVALDAVAPAARADERSAQTSEAKEPAVRPPETARNGRDIPGAVGEDIPRLMAEADQWMEEPEGRNRRNAFEHLRAAVVARFTDQSLAGTEAPLEEQRRVYRNDLADAVGSPRAALHRRRTQNGAGRGVATLRLSPAQRVDPAE